MRLHYVHSAQDPRGSRPGSAGGRGPAGDTGNGRHVHLGPNPEGHSREQGKSLRFYTTLWLSLQVWYLPRGGPPVQPGGQRQPRRRQGDVSPLKAGATRTLPGGASGSDTLSPVPQLEASPAVPAPRGLVTHHCDDLLRKAFPKEGLPLAQSSPPNWHLADPQPPPTGDAGGTRLLRLCYRGRCCAAARCKGRVRSEILGHFLL